MIRLYWLMLSHMHSIKEFTKVANNCYSYLISSRKFKVSKNKNSNTKAFFKKTLSWKNAFGHWEMIRLYWLMLSHMHSIKEFTKVANNCYSYLFSSRKFKVSKNKNSNTKAFFKKTLSWKNAFGHWEMIRLYWLMLSHMHSIKDFTRLLLGGVTVALSIRRGFVAVYLCQVHLW